MNPHRHCVGRKYRWRLLFASVNGASKSTLLRSMMDQDGMISAFPSGSRDSGRSKGGHQPRIRIREAISARLLGSGGDVNYSEAFDTFWICSFLRNLRDPEVVIEDACLLQELAARCAVNDRATLQDNRLVGDLKNLMSMLLHDDPRKTFFAKEFDAMRGEVPRQ